MKIYVFDLLAYDKRFNEFKSDRLIPYPLPRQYFDPEILPPVPTTSISDAWAEMDRLGYDGVGLNEHHTTPHGLMNSPNMMAAVGGAAHQAAQISDPRQSPAAAQSAAHRRGVGDGRLHVARAYLVGLRPRRAARIQGLSGADVGIARAIRRGVRHHHEGLDRGNVFHEGKFWSFKDISIWPRPYQQPHPPIWVPFTGSKETIEWAGKHNLNAVIHHMKQGLTEDIVGISRNALDNHGHHIKPDKICVLADAWVADSKARGAGGVRAVLPLFQSDPLASRQPADRWRADTEGRRFREFDILRLCSPGEP